MGEKMSSLLKRRRTSSMERDAYSPNKKQCAPAPLEALPEHKTSEVVSASHNQPSEAHGNVVLSAPTATKDNLSSANEPVISTVESDEGLSALQRVIEQEFNMQILMKHRELRLIEQELAKCQIGLEQLRRCELRPYPGNNGMSLDMSSGTGAAVKPSAGPVPPYAAPYGVTDGPYTRHYQHWLLQDPQFEPMQVEHISAVEAAGRPTRNSGIARKSTSKSLGRASDFGLPAYAAAPVKDKNLPQILRRSTDNQLVKLVCNNCHRWNFSSIQGFLNHCRIAHKVDYKSHDAAAIDCGQTLDEHELAQVPQDTQTQPVAAAKPNPKPITVPAPVAPMRQAPPRPSPAIIIPSKNLVHPLNSSQNTSDVTTPKHDSFRQPVRALVSSPVATPSGASTPLKKSSQVPRLSALFAKNGHGGDLEHLATAARQKIDFSTLEDDTSPGASALSSPATPLPAPGARTILGHSRSELDPARPPSRKGYRQPLSGLQRQRPTPLASTTTTSESLSKAGDPLEILESPPDSALNLSPQTAADSAPGLVSDDDDDNGSASEDEAPHTATAPMAPPLEVSARGCGSTTMDLDIAVEHDEDLSHHHHHHRGSTGSGDGHAVIIRRNDVMMDVDTEDASRGSSRRKVGKSSGGASN